MGTGDQERGTRQGWTGAQGAHGFNGRVMWASEAGGGEVWRRLGDGMGRAEWSPGTGLEEAGMFFGTLIGTTVSHLP